MRKLEGKIAFVTGGSSDSGIIDTPSNHSVDQTVERLKAILVAKGATLFAVIDHTGEAAKVGITMPPTTSATPKPAPRSCSPPPPARSTCL
jgi:hypothetical protein